MAVLQSSSSFECRVDTTQPTWVGGKRGPSAGAGNVGYVSGAGVEDIGLQQQLVDLPGRRGVELAEHHGGMTDYFSQLRAGVRPDGTHLSQG
jgi:hypothetical protein